MCTAHTQHFAIQIYQEWYHKYSVATCIWWCLCWAEEYQGISLVMLAMWSKSVLLVDSETRAFDLNFPEYGVRMMPPVLLASQKYFQKLRGTPTFRVLILKCDKTNLQNSRPDEIFAFNKFML